MTINVYLVAKAGYDKDASLQGQVWLGLLGSRSYQLESWVGTDSTWPGSQGRAAAMPLSVGTTG